MKSSTHSLTFLNLLGTLSQKSEFLFQQYEKIKIIGLGEVESLKNVDYILIKEQGELINLMEQFKVGFLPCGVIAFESCFQLDLFQFTSYGMALDYQSDEQYLKIVLESLMEGKVYQSLAELGLTYKNYSEYVIDSPWKRGYVTDLVSKLGQDNGYSPFLIQQWMNSSLYFLDQLYQQQKVKLPIEFEVGVNQDAYFMNLSTFADANITSLGVQLLEDKYLDKSLDYVDTLELAHLESPERLILRASLYKDIAANENIGKMCCVHRRNSTLDKHANSDQILPTYQSVESAQVKSMSDYIEKVRKSLSFGDVKSLIQKEKSSLGQLSEDAKLHISKVSEGLKNNSEKIYSAYKSSTPGANKYHEAIEHALMQSSEHREKDDELLQHEKVAISDEVQACFQDMDFEDESDFQESLEELIEGNISSTLASIAKKEATNNNTHDYTLKGHKLENRLHEVIQDKLESLECLDSHEEIDPLNEQVQQIIQESMQEVLSEVLSEEERGSDSAIANQLSEMVGKKQESESKVSSTAEAQVEGLQNRLKQRSLEHGKLERKLKLVEQELKQLKTKENKRPNEVGALNKDVALSKKEQEIKRLSVQNQKFQSTLKIMKSKIEKLEKSGQQGHQKELAYKEKTYEEQTRRLSKELSKSKNDVAVQKKENIKLRNEVTKLKNQLQAESKGKSRFR